MIRFTKNILKVVSLSIAVVLIAMVLGWFMVDDDTLVSSLSQQLQAVTGSRINYYGDVSLTRSLTPVLRIEQVLIEDHNKRYRFELNSFLIELNLARLLLGHVNISSLALGDARIALMQSASAEPRKTTSLDFLLRFFKLTFHDVQIGKLSIDREYGAEDFSPLEISAIAVQLRADSHTLALTGDLELAGEKLAINAGLSDTSKVDAQGILNFSLSAQGSGFGLDSDGQIALAQPDITVDAAVRARVSDLPKLPVGPDALVIPGALTAAAQLIGNIDQLALRKIVVHWQGAGLSEVKLNGEIENVNQLDGVELNLLGKFEQLAWLSPLFPDSMASLERATLSGQIVGNYKQLGIRSVDLEATTVDKLDLSLRGKFDVVDTLTAARPENIDLKFAFAAPNTKAARVLLFKQIPELGTISGKLDIRGNTDVPRLENIVIKTKHRKGVEVDLSGDIASFSFDPNRSIRGYALDAVLKATSASFVTKSLGLDLPLSGAMNLALRIEGESQALALNKINLMVGEEAALHVSAQGQLSFGRWDLVNPLQTVDLNVQVNTHNTQALGQMLGLSMPELGGLEAKARLHTRAGKHRLDNVHVQSYTGAPVQVLLTGSVNNVILFPQPTMRSIQLKVEVAAADTAQLNVVFGPKDWIPAIGPFEASTVITGSDRQLQVDDVVIVAGQEATTLINATGRIGTLSVVKHWHSQNTDLRIEASSASGSAFVKSLGYKIPELGPVKAEANIKGKYGRLALESVLIQIGKTDVPVVRVTGYIVDMFGDAKTRWDVVLNMDGHTLAEFSDHVSPPDFGSLLGRMVIANSDGTLGVDFLQIESSQNEFLSLAINGNFDDFKTPETLSLDVDLSAHDLHLIGALFDQKWPAVGPVKMKSAISQIGDKTELDVALSVDDMRFNASIGGVLDASPLNISGKISAQQFIFPSLFEGADNSAEQVKLEKSHIFSRLPIDLGWLKKAELDLEIDIESFSKAESSIESAQFVITQKDGHLSISPAVLIYPQGRLELDFQIDSQDPPQMSFKAYGKDLDPWQTLDIQQGRKTLETDVDIDVAVTTFGDSPHEFAANANGDIYITMKNGKIRRALLDMVLVDVVGWTIGKTTLKNFYDINCGVADYVIKQGVISTNAFLLDSQNITITGEGSIDLGNETVDYVILPKKKSRIISKADPVKINGALNNPSISVIPWKSAAETYGGLAFAPYIFVGISVFDYLTNALGLGSKSSPCLDYKNQYKSRREAIKP